jgi:hypothetical protein
MWFLNNGGLPVKSGTLSDVDLDLKSLDFSGKSSF